MVKRFPLIYKNNHVHAIDKGSVMEKGDVSSHGVIREVFTGCKKVHNIEFDIMYETMNFQRYFPNQISKIIASTDPTLGLPLLPDIEEDIEELANKLFPDDGIHNNRDWQAMGYVKGYKAAQAKYRIDRKNLVGLLLRINDENVPLFGSDRLKTLHKDVGIFLKSLNPNPLPTAVDVRMDECIVIRNGVVCPVISKTHSTVTVEGGTFKIAKQKGFIFIPHINNNYIDVLKFVYDKEISASTSE